MGHFRSAEVRQLLHNKFVVVLGDSIQRSVYKDLVKLLRTDDFLTEKQLEKRGEMSFENDTLVEGGSLEQMHNGTTYREVRQYRTGHHLVRFYFLTRVYSTYLESVLSDFQRGPQPDLVIVNSCIWDVNRYHDHHLEAYKTNLDISFQRLKEVLSPQCLIIWTMTMPVGFRDNEIPENIIHNLQMDMVEGNFFSATLADFHKLDVLDMHYHFRYDLRLRCRDAVHWDQLAHRKYSQILLTHIAQAWGVEIPKGNMLEGLLGVPGYTSFEESNDNGVTEDSYVNDSPLLSANITPRYYTPPRALGMPGYTSFEESNDNGVSGSSDGAGPSHSFTPGDNLYQGPEHPPTQERKGPALLPHPSGHPPSPPFADRKFLLPLPPMNFSPLSPFVPYPQEDWNSKMMPNREPTPRGDWNLLRPRGDWNHPRPRGEWNHQPLRGDWNHLMPRGEWNHPPPRGDWEHPPPREDWDHPPPIGDWEHPPPREDWDHPPPIGDWDLPPPREDWDHPPPIGDWDHPPPIGDWDHPPPREHWDHPPPIGDWDHPPPRGDWDHPPPRGARPFLRPPYPQPPMFPASPDHFQPRPFQGPLHNVFMAMSCSSPAPAACTIL
ncbi:hypothetical protein GDO81_028330 [Engystomops pustulosus]|uniref:PC-esterase domain containing 1A n=1 Tax=Engystomops pustulosus TaxID=76066 RepID=A0AAV6ZJC1_ENGPU|nr:hypothetical protein GDO81_028330 [Engystomops pustulosus]